MYVCPLTVADHTLLPLKHTKYRPCFLSSKSVRPTFKSFLNRFQLFHYFPRRFRRTILKGVISLFCYILGKTVRVIYGNKSYHLFWKYFWNSIASAYMIIISTEQPWLIEFSHVVCVAIIYQSYYTMVLNNPRLI